MVRKWVIFTLVFLVIFNGFSSVSATPPAKIVTSVVSNVVSVLVKWLLSLKSEPKAAVSSRSMMKFEGGYTVETVFDGSKLGIEPFSVEVSPNGDLLVLDAENSNIYKISMPLSRYGRPKLLAGSYEGYSGHVDGKPREARMNHPKGLTVDDSGNIYIADTMNMAIRKISKSGVTTIAGGGKWSRGGGHVDGPSEDAKFSNDFDVVYIGSTCSLLVVDRGNQAIREIQLNDDDCSYQYDGSFHSGIAVLVATAFFGYMLALLQRRVQAMFSSHGDSKTLIKRGATMAPMAPYQRPPKPVRPPLIPPENEPEKTEVGFFSSISRLVSTPVPPWLKSSGDYFLDSDGSLSIISFNIRISNHPCTQEDGQHERALPHCNGWDADYQQQQQMLMHHHQQQQRLQKHYSSNPQTYYEKNSETNEIVFGAVQEQDGRREAMVIKAVDYGDPSYGHHNLRPRLNYMGYSHGY
ncbi:putative inactive receptor kinase [Hibiscus syriacus]|uniref:Inactive receptor kinase n=1 Tax=Hibiscus syriacus TaxID=106335 RepID=A0A6A2ZCV9_HIBSY|nr:putative inactive receptor kinase [Hibiscus syriacus]